MLIKNYRKITQGKQKEEIMFCNNDINIFRWVDDKF